MGQILWLGIIDSFNPFAIATLLVFVGILGRWGRSYGWILWLGVFFIGAVFLANLKILLGAYDHFLDRPFVKSMVSGCAAVLGFLLVGVAAQEIKGWIRFQKTKNVRELLVGRLCFLQEISGESIQVKPPWFKVIGNFILRLIGLLGLACGAMWLTVIGQLWPRDYYLLTPFFLFHSGRNPQLASLVFLMYSLGFVLLLALVWMVVLRAYRSKKLKEFFTKKASFITMSCSGLMLAIGSGIVYLLLTQK
jgi:hypothetical protein